MDFMNACKIAYDLLKEDGFDGFYLIKETSQMWVFYGGDPDVTFYGLRTVIVDKKTGEGGWFDINHRRNELKESKEVQIPKEYRFSKAS